MLFVCNIVTPVLSEVTAKLISKKDLKVSVTKRFTVNNVRVVNIPNVYILAKICIVC